MSCNNWKEAKLGDVCEKITKGTTPTSIGCNFTEKGINYIKSESICIGRKLDYSKYAHIDNNTHHKLKRSQIQENDILFSMAGMFLGKTAIATRADIPANTNQAVAIIRLQDNINVSYIYYWLNQDSIKKTVNSSSAQSAQPNINLKQIGEIDILLPPLPEQKAIADTLSCLDDKIELNNKINKNLEAQAQAIFKSWFVDFEPFQDGEFVDSELGRIPKGWRVVNFSEVSKFIKGKKPDDLSPTKLKNQMQYLTIDVLNGGKPQYATADKMVITDDFDILMVMDGASSGTVYYGYNGIVGSTLAKLDIQSYKIREVLYAYLKLNESETKKHNTGSAIPHTDKNHVLKCKTAIPNDEKLKQVSDMLRNIRNSIIQNKRQTQTLTALRDTLLPKLMSGEIRVPPSQSIRD